MEENTGQAPQPSGSNRSSSAKNNKMLYIGLGAAAVIIVLILLVLKGGIGGGKAIATVDGTKIYQSQLDKEYKAYATSYKQSNKKNPDKKMEKEIKKLILERLIQQELIAIAAKKENIVVNKKELNERIDQIKKSTSKEQLDKTLKQMNWTMTDLENMIESQLLATKVREKITKGQAVTDKDIEKYYKDNKKNYLVPDTVSVKIATFKKQGDADAFAASVKSGKSFDEAVKKYIKGGVMAQSLGKDQITGIYGKELSDATFELAVGGLSSVVKTKSGLYVAKVDKKDKGHQKTFKEVKEEIKSMLGSQKQMEKFNTWLADVKKKAKIEIFDKDLKTSGKPMPSGHPQ